MHSRSNRPLLLRGLIVFGTLLVLIVFLLPTLPGAADGTSFFDHMDSYDTSRWNKADGWTNGTPFNVGWRADHILYSNSTMTITLDDLTCPAGCSGKPYASNELRTAGSGSDAYYGYGCYEARLKAVAGSGLDTGFFTYNGPYDQPPGGNGLHNEIDIEILGKNTTRMQANFFTNNSGGHEHMVDLTTITPTFDAAADFHNYAFQWTAEGIKWLVDGSVVHVVTNTVGTPTPVITLAQGGPQKIMMNLWAVDSSAAGWAGPFTYTLPVHAEADWIRYKAGPDCLKPEVTFTASPRDGLAPLTVVFTDTSISNVTQWLWNFGDTITSTQPNPTHTYTTDGSYTVTLMVGNPTGSNTLTRTGYITVKDNRIYLPLLLKH